MRPRGRPENPFLIVMLIAWVLAIPAIPSAPAQALTQTFVQVSSGSSTTCALTAAGIAYCWGSNNHGQIGDGTTTDRSLPTVVSNVLTFSKISAGQYTTCGLTTVGAAYCWGDNTYGQIGDNTTTERTSPTPVSTGLTFSSISVGYASTCALATDGSAYCWGYNGNYQIGDGTNTDHSTPAAVSGGLSFSSISVGYYTACALTSVGAAYCWGYNFYGEIGDGTTNHAHTPTAVIGGLTFSNISAGYSATCGVTTDGPAYCWGNNGSAQIGIGTWTGQVTSPTAVSGGLSFLSITVGTLDTCAVAVGNAAYCWGDNTDGRLGVGDTTGYASPTAVLGGLKFNALSAGDSTCGVTDISVYCWGGNGNGQLGDNTTTDRYVPTSTYFVESTSTTTVSVDPWFSFTVGNQSSACNGESNFIGAAGSATGVALGHIAVASNASGGQALAVSGNSGGGFSVYVRGNGASGNLATAGHNWTDVTGTYAAPAPLDAGEQFGFTYKDSTASSSVINPAVGNFVKLDNAPTNQTMGSSSSSSGSGCVSFDVQSSIGTPAGNYAATVIYTAIPNY